MRQQQDSLEVRTTGPGLYEVTSRLHRWVSSTGLRVGLLTLFCRHTSASLLIQENADPDVARDLSHYFAEIAPEDPMRYRHTTEGPDDMPAHLRAALTQTHLAIPIVAGELALGTWQGVYLFEHRRLPHRREILLHANGE
ncbi:MAG: YjbQ family protein [Alphaproteobacteria bacterium]|nr:YjbQ family protein [Alphaproteobacteria bacterium]